MPQHRHRGPRQKASTARSTQGVRSAVRATRDGGDSVTFEQHREAEGLVVGERGSHRPRSIAARPIGWQLSVKENANACAAAAYDAPSLQRHGVNSHLAGERREALQGVVVVACE